MARVHAVLARTPPGRPGRGGAGARDRDERGARCRERRGVPGRGRARHGFATRLLSGAEEAELTYRGVCSRQAVADGALICDIGGGSTELVLGGPDGVRDRESLDIGCVRLSERHLHTDPPTATSSRRSGPRRPRRCRAADRPGPRARRRRRHGDDARDHRHGARGRDPRGDRRAPAPGRGGRAAAGRAVRAPARAAPARARPHARARTDDRRRRGDPLGRRPGDRRRRRLVSERDILHGAALAAADL